MAYFHCLIGGGSSGGGYELTVTCDADFAGTTITCTDGVTTLTQTCPSASPYEVVFAIPNGGEWTVSGVIGGATYTASIDIPDSLELHSVPQGSTVLPTDDIQTWLACAGITDKSYTTLAEVLADSTTLLALMSDNNAVDYLVRSTSWAGDTSIKIPIMTSNTTPSGECSQSSTHATGYEAWRSVSGSDQTAVLSSADANDWWQYEFDEAVVCNSFTVQEFNNPSAIAVQAFWSEAEILASNDGTNFTKLAEVTGTISQGVIYNKTFNNATPYLYYRLHILQWGTEHAYKQVGKNLQFYQTGITQDSTAMTDIGANNYCANTLLADSTWRNAICNSTYFESVLNAKVPTMTSATTPSGSVSASAYWDDRYLPYKAFDGTWNTNGWLPPQAATLGNTWIQYQFTESVILNLFKVQGMDYSSASRMTTFKIMGSNDGFVSDSHDVGEVNAYNYNTITNYLDFANSEAYQYYRFVIIADTNNSPTNYSGYNMQLYGRSAS